jgi:quinolinate synthase
MTDTAYASEADAENLSSTDLDFDPFLDLEEEINRLRQEKNAVILAHVYQDSEIQDIADFVGDSLDLSRKAAATDADIIVFCGVRFMAEVAKILSPGKTVILPDLEAGCSLEQSCPPDKFRVFREAHPDHIALSYINCSAEVKALSDIIVTSSNAEAIINQIPKSQPILFAPDKYLGSFLARKTGRNMTLWPGTCVVHEQFSLRELVRLKTLHPEALVAAHPECPEDILREADHIGSTSSLTEFVITSDAPEFIIATEPKIIHQMEKLAPGKTFIGAPGSDGCIGCNNCPFMALNTLEKLYVALRDQTPEIQLPEKLRVAAEKPLRQMLEMSPLKAVTGTSRPRAVA